MSTQGGGFGPRVTEGYDSRDPITGRNDDGQDTFIRRKVGSFSSIDQASGVLGNKRGTLFIVESSTLAVYIDDNVVKSVTLT